MARALRRHQPDGFTHVTTRGNRQAAIFVDTLDYLDYLERLEVVTERVGWQVLSYCLMPNHAHLLLDATIDRLSAGMQMLSSWYARRFNWRHAKSGHTFQGRFSSTPTERQEHLLEVVRYIAQNPVRAGLCERPPEWRWSSYPFLVAMRDCPPFLDRTRLLSLFHDEETAAIACLRAFVELSEPDMAVG